MITQTWAETTLATSTAPLPFAAQRTADGKTLVIRVVNTIANATPLTVSLTGGMAAAGPSYTLWTLSGDPNADNTPSNPTAISPVSSQQAITAGATSIPLNLPAHAFVIAVVTLQ